MQEVSARLASLEGLSRIGCFAIYSVAAECAVTRKSYKATIFGRLQVGIDIYQRQQTIHSCPYPDITTSVHAAHGLAGKEKFSMTPPKLGIEHVQKSRI